MGTALVFSPVLACLPFSTIFGLSHDVDPNFCVAFAAPHPLGQKTTNSDVGPLIRQSDPAGTHLVSGMYHTSITTCITEVCSCASNNSVARYGLGSIIECTLSSSSTPSNGRADSQRRSVPPSPRTRPAARRLTAASPALEGGQQSTCIACRAYGCASVPPGKTT